MNRRRTATRAQDRRFAPHRWRAALAFVLGAGLLAGALAAGCSAAAPVSLAARSADAACRHLVWPEQVGQQSRTPTDPEDPSVAAWGQPAIIARCGVATPGPTTRECLAVDDVDWIVDRLSDGMRFTTYGRSPAIEVLVPAGDTPEPMVLGAFTATARMLPTNGHRCR